MSPTPESQSPSQAAQAEKTDQSGKIGKLFPALSKAWESLRSKENKDKGMLMKLGIFFSTFFDEMKGVEKEKKEVSAETKAAVDKDVDETLKSAREAAALKTEVEQEDKKFYDEVLAMSVAANEELDSDRQAAVHTGLDTVNRAVEAVGEESDPSQPIVTPLELDQAKALGAVGISTLGKLKARYSTPEKFKEALDRLDKISDSSKYPLKKLMHMAFLNIFRVKINAVGEGLQGVGSAFGLTEKGEGMKFMEDFGLSVNDALKLKNINGNPMEDEQEVVAIMQKSFFPNTSAENAGKIVEIINKLIVDKTRRLDSQTLTDLVFNIADSDISRLVEILGGKKGQG